MQDGSAARQCSGQPGDGGAALEKAGKAAEKNLKKVLDKRRSLRYNKQAVTKTRQRAGP